MQVDYKKAGYGAKPEYEDLYAEAWRKLCRREGHMKRLPECREPKEVVRVGRVRFDRERAAYLRDVLDHPTGSTAERCERTGISSRRINMVHTDLREKAHIEALPGWVFGRGRPWAVTADGRDWLARTAAKSDAPAMGVAE